MPALGNLRFIEGNLSANTIAGVTWNYQKWSLSGSHLMIVLAGTVEDGTTINENTELILFTLPAWVTNKVYPILGEIVSFQSETAVNAWTQTKSFNTNLGKSSSGHFRIWCKSTVSFDTGRTYAFRIQYDLLIDGE